MHDESSLLSVDLRQYSVVLTCMVRGGRLVHKWCMHAVEVDHVTLLTARAAGR